MNKKYSTVNISSPESISDQMRIVNEAPNFGSSIEIILISNEATHTSFLVAVIYMLTKNIELYSKTIINQVERYKNIATVVEKNIFG